MSPLLKRRLLFCSHFICLLSIFSGVDHTLLKILSSFDFQETIFWWFVSEIFYHTFSGFFVCSSSWWRRRLFQILYTSLNLFFKINELYPFEFKCFISRLCSGLHVQISNWKWPIGRITITSTTQIEIDSLIATYPPTDFFPSSHLFIRRH